MEYHIKGEFEDGKPELIFCHGKRVGDVDGEERRFRISGRSYRVSGFLTLTCRDERTGKVIGTYRKSLMNSFWDAGAGDSLQVAGQKYTVQRGSDVTRAIVCDPRGKEVLICGQDDDDEIEITARFSTDDIREEHHALLCLVFFAYYTEKRWSE